MVRSTFQLTDLTGVAGEVDFYMTARLAGDVIFQLFPSVPYALLVTHDGTLPGGGPDVPTD